MKSAAHETEVRVIEKQFHPVAALLPLMSGEEFAQLVEDIRSNGLREPIWLHPTGSIIDGRNRYRACIEAGVTPTYRTWDGNGSLVAFVLSQNLHRRHLTMAQRAAVAAEALPMLEDEASAKQSAAGGDRRSDSARGLTGNLLPTKTQSAVAAAETLEQKIAQAKPREPQARDVAAKTAGVNRQYVSDAKKIQKAAPEVFERMKAGGLSMQDAKREVRAVESRKMAAEKPMPAEDAAIIAALEKGRAVVVNQERHAHAMTWAEQHGKLERVDRGSPWGNVFLLDQDGDRDAVCDHYRDHYLPFKPSLLKKIPTLRGKALLCHCAPQRCHGDELAKRANAN